MEDYFFLSFLTGLMIAAGLAFIPANIAKRKGYSFGLWWFYGWMLWIVAIIHVSLIPDKNISQTPIIQNNIPTPYPAPNPTNSAVEELKKYKELLDLGIISDEEFRVKKEQLLNRM